MEDIRLADSFIDALADGRPVAPQDSADAELAALLGSWRDETRWPPETGLITEADAVAALNAGLGEKRSGPVRERRSGPTAITPRRSHRGLSVVGAAAAAVLSIGGFGAVVAGSGPDDPLYGMRTMLFGVPREVRDDQVALAVRAEMQQVQQLISQGDWQQAQERLVAASAQVASIGNEQQKQDLMEQFNDLSAKVVERNPEATAPPGITYTVPPDAAELVPAVAPPTSTPSAPAEDERTTPPSPEPNSAESPASSGIPTSGAESSAAATSPSAAATTPSAAATTPSATATSASPATSATQQSQVATTPTSAAPATSAPATSPSAVATTSAAPRSEAPATTSAPAAAAETTPETTPETAAETAPETTAGATAETTAETVTTAETETTAPAEAAAETSPETSAETEAAAPAEAAAETSPETSAETETTAPAEAAPETAAKTATETGTTAVQPAEEPAAEQQIGGAEPSAAITTTQVVPEPAPAG